MAHDRLEERLAQMGISRKCDEDQPHKDDTFRMRLQSHGRNQSGERRRPKQVMQSEEDLTPLRRAMEAYIANLYVTFRAKVQHRIVVRRPITATIAGKELPFDSTAAKFRALAEEWLEAHAGRSRTDFAHPAYLQIVGMGSEAIPLLLGEVKERSGHWFTALRSIVGTSPAPPEIRGDYEAVTQAWLNWGTENGYGQI
jgi:hypothetical protein